MERWNRGLRLTCRGVWQYFTGRDGLRISWDLSVAIDRRLRANLVSTSSSPSEPKLLPRKAFIMSGRNAGVPLLDVARGNLPIREELLEALGAVIDSGRFLFGPEVAHL